MYKIVFIRHGQSEWNASGRFTGWTDVALTDQGRDEAKKAGELLKDYLFDLAITSILKRNTETLDIILSELNLDISTENYWRLNERHYGALQGLNKIETVKEYGKDQVFQWRRGYDVKPPLLTENDPRHSSLDPLYKNIPKEYLPRGESLEDTEKRVMVCWDKNIAPEIKLGKNIILVGHGNSLRALIKNLDNISKEDISSLDIPTGIPLVYELDEDLRPIKSYYLGDQEEIKKRTKEVKNQIEYSDK
jgi:2,3-bisphosphoglycerate-dependent phosphoglycerate mutase